MWVNNENFKNEWTLRDTVSIAECRFILWWKEVNKCRVFNEKENHVSGQWPVLMISNVHSKIGYCAIQRNWMVRSDSSIVCVNDLFFSLIAITIQTGNVRIKIEWKNQNEIPWWLYDWFFCLKILEMFRKKTHQNTIKLIHYIWNLTKSNILSLFPLTQLFWNDSILYLGMV